MKKLILLIAAYFIFCNPGIAQSVGIGTTVPDAPAQLEMTILVMAASITPQVIPGQRFPYPILYLIYQQELGHPLSGQVRKCLFGADIRK